MASPRLVLDTIRIASPCTASWEGMAGTDRVRFCAQCGLSVYNISGMGHAEAESFIEEAQGRTCVRFYRRRDGTILTQDCPGGPRRVGERVARALAVAGLCVSGVIAIGGLVAAALAIIFGPLLTPPAPPAAPLAAPAPAPPKGEWIMGKFDCKPPQPGANGGPGQEDG
jgi:hypothetical protein